MKSYDFNLSSNYSLYNCGFSVYNIKLVLCNYFNAVDYNYVSLCEELRNEIQGYSQDESHLYDEWCNDIKSQYEKYIDLNNKYTCQQVMYILYFISTDPISLYNDDKCKYLYYWIYQALLQNNKNYDMALKLYRIFLKKFFSFDIELHTCKSYEDVSKNIILEESAELTELYVTINNNGKTFDCGCAQNCSQLYNVYVKECDNNFDNDYCRELENFKLKYEEKMKSINACEGAQKILPSAIKNDLHFVIIIPIIILTILSFLVFALYKVKLFVERLNNILHLLLHILPKNEYI
ncbi:hypothetical protein PVMG_05743 [Plasmodium vivax Mauritania I]|uniref:Variable surface protein n=1 Tax=Plasmodium vivax Mauritania I TaxID=1035515 RepID=A0A0J9T6J6_PLAVI|nr:hypothetical protein PVMG_05743 [Plasmodium vivax Mauritania I]